MHIFSEWQLIVGKQLVTTSDFNDNILPAVTQWTLLEGASLDNNNTTIKLTNNGEQYCSAIYTYTLNQSTAKLIRLSAESYSQGVVTSPSIWYSLRFDVTYNDNSTELYSHVPFTGSSSWESKEIIFCPQQPIKQVKVYVMLYNLSGTAWFRNITLQVDNGENNYNFGKFDDTVVFNQTTNEGYLIKQFGANENWYEITNGQTGQNWSLEAESSLCDGFTIHTATITNTGSNERAGVLAYRIPVSGGNVKWCNPDMRTFNTTNSYNIEYYDELASRGKGQTSSKHLWGGVVSDTNGYAIAIDPEYPCQFKIRYSACNQELFIVFDLGFTSSGSAQDNATVKFVTWNFDPTIGMRQVVNDYYKLYPDAFCDCIAKRNGEHGIWWFLKDLSDNSISNIKDFGFKFHQQPPANEVIYDDYNDILSMIYVAPWELFIYGADLPGWPEPSYADVEQLVNNLYNNGDLTAIGIVNSGSKDSNGRYRYLTTAPWSPTMIRFQCNPAPGIRPNIYDASIPSEYNAYRSEWGDPSLQTLLTLPNTWDGIMCDNVTNGYLGLCAENTPIDYDSTHFCKMNTPLTHDKNGVVGIGLEMMIWEYFKGVSQDMNNLMDADGRLRIILANGSPPSFVACKLDVHGTEIVWDLNNGWVPSSETVMLEHRMKAGRKPLIFLMNPYEHNIGPGSDWMNNAKTQKFFARCCAFGIMPSFGITDGGNSTGMLYFNNPVFFETLNPSTIPSNMTDRNLFQKYIPIIKKLSEAGWEPLRQATVNDNDVFLERFGSEYITVFNPTADTKNIVINYLPASINMTGKELVTGTDISWLNGKVSLTISPEQVAVLEIPSLINFKLDDGNGTLITAENPYYNITGTTINTSWTDGVDGQIIHALNFDGVSSWASIAENNLFKVADNGMTYAAWIKADTLDPSGHNMVLCHKSGHYISVHSKSVCFKLTTQDNSAYYCSGQTTLENSKWYHIAATYDREGYMKIFVNGRQDGPAKGPYKNPQSNRNSFVISNYGTGGYFDGIIDDLQIVRNSCSEKRSEN